MSRYHRKIWHNSYSREAKLLQAALAELCEFLRFKNQGVNPVKGGVHRPEELSCTYLNITHVHSCTDIFVKPKLMQILRIRILLFCKTRLQYVEQ